jgi:tRNA-dihydrouridine synthase B
MGTNEDIIWLAPLHGITYYYFRNVLFQHCAGIDRVIAPFVPAQLNEKLNVKKWVDLHPENNSFIPVIPQLMGNDPQAMVDTILALQKTYFFPFINWNIGCPMNPIVRKKRGCGIMPYLSMIEEVVQKVQEETTISFSIKMRLGMWDKNEGIEILQMLNQYSLENIIIHPRLGIQQYDGNVDLDTFEEMISLSNHRIVYSGDIVDFEGYQELKHRFPQITDWMLGRGALRDPFLIQEIKNQNKISTQEKRKLFQSYYEDMKHSLYGLKGEKSALPKLKELWKYYAHFFQLSENELKRLLQCVDVVEFEKIVSLIS